MSLPGFLLITQYCCGAQIVAKSRKCLILSQLCHLGQDESVPVWCNTTVEEAQSSIWAFNILNMSRLPLIGIPADRRLCGKHYFHMVGEKYIEAVAAGANAVPVLVPALGAEIDLPSLAGGLRRSDVDRERIECRTPSLRRTGESAGNAT